MARIERDTVSYFPHEAKAALGDTLTILQGRYGNDGYAVWFKILEKLAATDNHYLDLRSPMRWQLFVAYLGVNEITMVEMMDLLVEIQAIDADLWKSRVVWCQNLVNNLASVYRNRKRELPSIPIITNGNGITTGGNPITTPDNTHSRVEEVKYSKVEESKVGGGDFGAYIKDLQTNRYPGLKVAELWEDCQSWYADHNKPMKDAKRALNNWCKRELEIHPLKKALPTTKELKEGWNQ